MKMKYGDIPTNVEIGLREFDNSLGDDLPEPENGIAKFFENAEFAKFAGADGVATLQKIGKSSAWLQRLEPRTAAKWFSQPLAKTDGWEEKLIGDGDGDVLQKFKRKLKPNATLTFKTRTDEYGNIFREGLDANGELKSSVLVYEAEE